MTLHVPFESFPETAKRVLGGSEAYVSAHGGGVLVTASAKDGANLVRAFHKGTVEEAMARLRDSGLDVFEGVWSPDDGSGFEPDDATAAFIAAVAYASGEDRPGVWVDAFTAPPTPVQVLRGMFDEFRETGELGEVSFEEFVRLASPNVIVVSPTEIQSFLAQKEGC